MIHLQITTDNEIGLDRRQRNYSHWEKRGLKPTYVHSSNPFVDFIFLSHPANSRVRGMRGCLETHRKAWELLISENHPYALITEDDAIPDEKLHDEISLIQEILKASTLRKPCLIQLAHFIPPKITPKRFLVSMFHILKYRGPLRNAYVEKLSFGTHGYVINRDMAIFLLGTLSGCLVPIDDQFISASRNSVYKDMTFTRRLRSRIDQDLKDSAIDQSNMKFANSSGFISNLISILLSLADADCERKSLVSAITK